MQKIRYFIRLVFAFLQRFKGVIVFSTIAGVFIFMILRLAIPFFFSVQTEKIGVTGRYTTQDLPDFILNDLSEGLTKLNDIKIPEPNIAKSWETPDKGKTWIFHLDHDKKWLDGKTIDSDSINYEFLDLTVTKPDKNTISFELKEPFSPFPSIVSKPIFRTGLIGTGSWKVDKLSIFSNVVQEITISNTEKHKKIFKFYPTSEMTKLAFKLGEVDKVVNLHDSSPFDTWEVVNITKESKNDQVVTIFFNTQDKFLSEKSVRQALNYAIDKETLDGNRAYSPIPPDSWAYNSQVKKYSYDPKRAKELLEDLPSEFIKDVNIKLISTPNLLPAAEKIAANWTSVGINTQVLVSSIIPDDFQAYLTIFDSPNDPDQYPIWHSTKTDTNISKYKNFRIDKLLEDGRISLEFEERRKVYLDFQRFLLEDVPAAFLYHPSAYTIERK